MVEGLEPTPVMPPTGPEPDGRPHPQPQPQHPHPQDLPAPAARQQDAQQAQLAQQSHEFLGTPDEAAFAEAAYKVFRLLIDEQNDFPTAEALDIHLSDGYGVTHPRSGSLLRRMIPAFKLRYQKDLESEHIA
ncbi:hypothetical protein [Streptomyces sp. NPDC002990]